MKKLLWYTTIVPLSILYIVWMILAYIPVLWMTLFDVVDVLLRRYEYWCFDVDRATFINSPYNKSLKQVWADAYEKACS
jgi:hypothetical protein